MLFELLAILFSPVLDAKMQKEIEVCMQDFQSGYSHIPCATTICLNKICASCVGRKYT